MVAARKKNNEIRICIDPRDLNTALQRPRHPMRTIEEVTANMPGAKVFSILDAKNGFRHIPLSEQSKKLTCFNTPFGRYVFNRMPYGINSGSEVFQRSMEELFAGYPCEVIVDDMLIWGKDIEEHDGKLERVLKRASQINLKLNVAKCKFRVKQVTYVGHVLSEDGTHPDPAKIKAIINMPTPTEKQELQRFLGMINYISKFVENFSETTAPLRELLHNDVEWCWQDRHQKTFEALKRAITNPPVLAYYNIKKPVTLTCDASKSGLGAACLQEGRPVAYASRALTETEQNYAQIEKELLAVVFACKRFDDFVYGRPIEVETDHKPLVTILNKPLCAAPTRLQKMMLTLYRYNINITYKQGKELHIADALSRAYLPETKGGETTQYEVMTVFPISDTRKKQLQNAITTDTTSLQLTKLIQEGWPNTIKTVPKAARDFYPFRDELTVQDGMIVKGTRVIIPISLHQEYLTELHRGHPGAEGMKRRVRNTVYWPNINEEVDRHVSMCSTCNKHKSHQQKEPLKQLPTPELPWSIVASDLFELDGNSYLIIVDSYSGWWEIEKMTNTTSTSVITQMKRHFATHGIPVTLYTDNGPQYVSEKFKAFTNEWEFNHKTSSPYYPQSNGLAEQCKVQNPYSRKPRMMEQISISHY